MVELLTSREMQELDRKTIEEIGIPGIVLMEHAGKSCANLIKTLFQTDKRILVICGKGNNGGDGFVVARWLNHWGYDVEVSLIGNPESMKDDCKENFRIAKELLGDRVIVLPDLKKIEEQIKKSEVIVDAILGTGLTKRVEGFYKEVIDLINRLKGNRAVISVDIPSGINADTGYVHGSAITADYTVTFGRLKRALFIYPARKYAGRVFLVDIGIPKNLKTDSKVYLVEEIDAMKLFPKRDPMAHKGNYGHLMVITGSPGKTGAGIMAGNSAIKMGTGLVTLIVPKSLNAIYESQTLEVMSEPVYDTDGFIGTKAVDRILKVLERATALAIGPGLGQHEETLTVLKNILTNIDIPVVIDADGINLISRSLDILEKARCSVILTPHPGEFMRLTGESKERVLNERLEVATTWAQKLGVIMVLKGAGTITATPDGRAYINPTGNPGMATGGSGDVLTGIIGALLAMNHDPVTSAYIGVFIHGLSGDLAMERVGTYGLTASDMIEEIPYILSNWEKGVSVCRRTYEIL